MIPPEQGLPLEDERAYSLQHVRALEATLRQTLAGDVRFDVLARTIYATDASIYEIPPTGVVLPKSADDVVKTVDACRQHKVPIIARGAGTGLTGGAIGHGVLLDLSRYMHKIGAVDTDAQTVQVEPGVVLDDLNAAVKTHGLHFAPDVATSSRATIGGMIANNSCGARSVWYGRTVDHVAQLSLVTADGKQLSFSANEHSGVATSANGEWPIMEGLGRIRDAYFDEIQLRFPKILRSNGGYGLDRLGPPGTPADVTRIICGSEGTLGIVVSAILKLSPLPRHTVVVVLQFHDLLDALSVTPDILEHKPSAVELIDNLIITAGRSNAALYRQCEFITGKPTALLAVEFIGDDAREIASCADRLVADCHATGAAYERVILSDTRQQDALWQLRKAGLGLLMSRPGDEQPYAFVEDSAVDPLRLRDYIEQFTSLLKSEGVTAGYYAHASVGCLHVRPILNLKRSADVEKMQRIAGAVADLALQFGGAMTGEHGDGILRSCWIEKMYGPRIVEAFRAVKRLFDPDNLLNPHKIVDPWLMTEHLRQQRSTQETSPSQDMTALHVLPMPTALDFSAHGGMAGLAEMCSGVGQCRQRSVGTMCPSHMATRDETHTTRARANALRVALSNRGLLNGLNDEHLDEVMDLCLACKACKTECPTGVDMARLKSEFLFQRVLRDGATLQQRMIAAMPRIARLGGRFPRLANAIAQSSLARRWVERRAGLDRRIPPPRWAKQPFRSWWRKRNKRFKTTTGNRRVVLFVDTWTNAYAPQVGIAAVKILEAAKYAVICPETVCCGRPAISKGLLGEAKQLGERNVRILAPFAAEGVPIVGTEPSCVLTLVDETPQLVRTAGAQLVAEHAQMIESFLAQLLKETPTALQFAKPECELIYHAHCHQRAMVGCDDAQRLIQHVWGESGSVIDAGCCGMAGSFGHEIEHYEVARMIGEDRLFPAVRSRGSAKVAVSGFSCGQQITHHTDAAPKHLIECVAALLDPGK